MKRSEWNKYKDYNYTMLCIGGLYIFNWIFMVRCLMLQHFSFPILHHTTPFSSRFDFFCNCGISQRSVFFLLLTFQLIVQRLPIISHYLQINYDMWSFTSTIISCAWCVEIVLSPLSSKKRQQLRGVPKWSLMIPFA